MKTLISLLLLLVFSGISAFSQGFVYRPTAYTQPFVSTINDAAAARAYLGVTSGNPATNLSVYSSGTTNAALLVNTNHLVVTNGNVGIGTSAPLAPLHVGNANVNNSVDAVVLMSRLVTDSVAGNGHGFSDSSIVSRSGNIGYNSYDARHTVIGANNYDHFAAFQAAPVIGTAGTTAAFYGLYSQPVVNDGVVSSSYGVLVADATGTGSVGVQYGLKTQALTKGALNYGVYIEANDSYFNGQIQIGVNTPGYLSAPSDGAISITAAGANKNIELTPSGSGSAVVNGANLRVLGGYVYSDRTVTPNFVLNSGGANHGQIFNEGTDGFSLGYGADAGTIGTAALTWKTSGNVGVGTTTPSTALDVVGSGTFSGYLASGVQSLSGPGAVNVTTGITEVTTTGALDALTLANGVAGQEKTIVHGVAGGSFVLTPTTKTGFTTFTSTVVGESITLVYLTTRGWIVKGSYLGMIAP